MIKIGILGCSNFALNSIIPSLFDLTDKYKLIGIATRDVSKAKTLASNNRIKIFDGYSSILSKELIDAVYIPLPNSMHYEWINYSLDAGIHVLVEKSLACNMDDVKKLNIKAKKNKLVLFENFQFRFHIQLKYILDVIESGILGELRCIRSSFGFPPFQDKNNIRYQKELGGGALLDAGAYPIKISQILLGNDINVEASKLYFDEERGVDLWGGAFLKQQKGDFFSEIAFGFDNYYQCSLELWGSIGKLFTNRIFTAKPGYKPELIIETGKGKEEITLDSDNHFKNMLHYFYNLLHNEANREDEYNQNINQARLISELKEKAKIE